MSKEKIIIADQSTQVDESDITKSPNRSDDSFMSNRKSSADQEVPQVDSSHTRAQQYLEDHPMLKVVPEIHHILDQAIFSVTDIKDNISKAINSLQQIKLESKDEKEVAVVCFLENLYDRSKFIDEQETEEIFVEALSLIHQDKEVQGLIEELYLDYFE